MTDQAIKAMLFKQIQNIPDKGVRTVVGKIIRSFEGDINWQHLFDLMVEEIPAVRDNAYSDELINAATEIDDTAGWDYNPVALRSLKKGAWFTLKPIAYPTDSQVYVKDDFDRESRKFLCGRRDDISYSRLISGDKIVYTNFNY